MVFRLSLRLMLALEVVVLACEPPKDEIQLGARDVVEPNELPRDVDTFALQPYRSLLIVGDIMP